MTTTFRTIESHTAGNPTRRPGGADRSPCGTGTAEWTIDPDDPLRNGFLVLG